MAGREEVLSYSKVFFQSTVRTAKAAFPFVKGGTNITPPGPPGWADKTGKPQCIILSFFIFMKVFRL